MIELTAKMIVPALIGNAQLITCSVAEPAPGEQLWVSGATYAVGDERIRAETHQVYKRKTAGAGETPPESDPANWLEIGYTHRWKQFDRKIGSRTSASAGPLVTTLAAGSVEGLALLDVVGRSVRIDMTESPTGATVYERVIDLDDTPVADVYDWMYGEYQPRTVVVLTDLPGQFPSGHLTVTVNGPGEVGIGATVAGRVHAIGATEYDAGAGIINFGEVIDDGFGNREWQEGGYADRITLPLLANRGDFARIRRQLARYRSTPCVYIGSDRPELSPLVCYGVYRDLYITVPGYALIRASLEVDGLNNLE